MKCGSAPTDLKARTGLFTPPGISRSAASKSFLLFVVFINKSTETLPCVFRCVKKWVFCYNPHLYTIKWSLYAPDYRDALAGRRRPGDHQQDPGPPGTGRLAALPV